MDTQLPRYAQRPPRVQPDPGRGAAYAPNTARARAHQRHTGLRAVGLALLLLATPGCGALLLVGGASGSAIAFATGELRATEDNSLAALDEACRIAVETLGYEEVESTRSEGRARWRAVTVGGDPVDIHLIAKESDETVVRIRIGVFGNEGRSRLVLEQIRQSL